MNIVNVADLKNPETGLMYRQENLAKSHKFPIDSLVEETETGLRLYVVRHTRDCDGTPLYSLSFRQSTDIEEQKEGAPGEDSLEYSIRIWNNGYNSGATYSGLDEDSLVLIK